jgi:hypothetical protein
MKFRFNKRTIKNSKKFSEKGRVGGIERKGGVVQL